MIGAAFLLICAIFLGVCGQLLLRLSVTETDGPSFSLGFLNVPFAAAALIYFISLICYTLSLRVIPLQIAFPSVSVSYVIVAWFSNIFWGSPFGIREILAFLLIFIALYLLVYSQNSA